MLSSDPSDFPVVDDQFADKGLDNLGLIDSDKADPSDLPLIHGSQVFIVFLKFWLGRGVLLIRNIWHLLN